MNIKSLLLGSAAALVAVSGARAADAVVVAEPEPVEYVRVCDAYGAGFFYIPGTETCLKIGGYVRSDVYAGDDAYDTGDNDTYGWQSRAALRFDARSETELGTLRSFIETRFDYKQGFTDGNGQSTTLAHGYIELGGFRVGVTDSQFDTWTGSAGNVLHDDVIAYAGGRTNQISYTFAGGNGFSALIGLEQGSGSYKNGLLDEEGEALESSYGIDDYLPHVVAGAKFEQSWGGISAVAAYDAVVEDFAGKVRLDVKINDTISAFVLAGYQSGWENTKRTSLGLRGEKSYFGAWNGDYAVWGGLSAKVNEKATISGQVAYEEDGTVGAALNVAYEIVPGFTITPEIAYTKFGGDREKSLKDAAGNNKDDSFGGIIHFQRNF